MITFDKLVVGNAGGMVKTLADVERFCKSSATRITVGSITMHGRAGNVPVPPGDVYFYDEVTGESGNSLGLPNEGVGYYSKLLPQMVAMAHAAGKELWASVNGESVEEIVWLVEACFKCGVDGVEINLACPNVHDKGKQKPLFCEDPTLVEDILWRLVKAGFKGKKIGIKVSPNDNEALIADICHVVQITDIATEVVCCNTKGGQRFVRNGIDMIAFMPPGSDEVKHVGGQAGKPIHELCVRVATLYTKHLPPDVDVLGVGGNFEAEDAMDFLRVGCKGFMCATSIMKFGPPVLGHISLKLMDLMDEAEAA